MPDDGELFPPSQRVFYERAPLTEVVCQLQFPPVLRIESALPAEFQERIRHIFPLLERTQPLPKEVPAEVAQLLGAAQLRAGFAFRTEDRKCTLTLGSEAIGLSTSSYSVWDDFMKMFRPPLDALVDIYGPSFFQRVGLRYINIIQRSSLGLQERPWIELLQPEILGELALPDFESHAIDMKKNIRVAIPNRPGCALYLQHGFAKRQNADEILYRLDFDFYKSDKTEVRDARSTLDSFNTMVGRAFRGCITEELHGALGPRPLAVAAGTG